MESERPQKRPRGNKGAVPDEATLIDNADRRSCKGREDLTSVILSNNVTNIGEEAFSQCKRLKSMALKMQNCRRTKNHVCAALQRKSRIMQRQTPRR